MRLLTPESRVQVRGQQLEERPRYRAQPESRFGFSLHNEVARLRIQGWRDQPTLGAVRTTGSLKCYAS